MLLRVLVFVCGAALMALEILGARVLAPVLGNSIFVWGALISSVMVAMSLGYWLGGLLSEKTAHLRALGLAAASGGVLAVAAPSIATRVLPWAATLGPRMGPLTASLAIFFLPTMLLSTISPVAVKVASRTAEGVGRTAGGLYSLSTAGSILGSLGTAFWLIPLAPVDTLVIGTGLVLVVAGTLAAFAPHRPVEGVALPSAGWTAAVGCVAVVGLVLGIGTLGSGTDGLAGLSTGDRVVYKADTQYHHITVYDRGSVRSLKFDSRRQSAIDLADGYTSAVRYTDYLHLALAIKPDAKRVLVIGLGGGALPKRMWHDYPSMRIDSVEIDPVVVDVAKRFFGMPDDPRLRVFTGDGRQYVASTKDRYDVVVIDAYYADSLPFHLATTEFFKQVDKVMNPGGVVAYNIISSVEGPDSKLFRGIYRTSGEVWRTRWTFPLGLGQEQNPTAIRNVILLATNATVDEATLRKRVTERVGGLVRVPKFQGFCDDLYTASIPTTDVPVLTDRYAPVDSLIPLH
jgi:spermidine synthase